MKFSVLVNNYNYGRFLAATIESVLNQTHQDFELVIVDDGSTDDSLEIISRFSDPRICTIAKKNGGQGSAFNAGLAHATGDYIAFLDSDDVWDPEKLSRCAEILRAEPDVVLLNHSYRQIDVQGQTNARIWHPRTLGDYDFLADLRSLETEFSFVPTSFLIGRRKECMELRIDEVRWRIAADTPVLIGLALRGRVLNIADVLGSYRIHSTHHGLDFDTAQLEKHLQLFFLDLNENLERIGSRERFLYSKTHFALSQAILKAPLCSVRGVFLRIQRLGRRFTRPQR